jgi:hypothetical protein
MVSETPENFTGKLASFPRRRAADAPLWQDEDGAVSFLCTI